MNPYQGLLLAFLGISFVMGWYGFAGFVMLAAGFFVLFVR